jgi:hypothetical protein
MDRSTLPQRLGNERNGVPGTRSSMAELIYRASLLIQEVQRLVDTACEIHAACRRTATALTQYRANAYAKAAAKQNTLLRHTAPLPRRTVVQGENGPSRCLRWDE